MTRSVIVIGSGIGGLSAAILLARRGCQVTVLEKNTEVGGKAGRWEDRGYRFDTGPTLLTMPFVIEEFFRSAGVRMEDYVTWASLDPICRYHWIDGLVIDAHADRAVMQRELRKVSPEASAAYGEFLDHAARIYASGADPFLYTPFMSLGGGGILRRWHQWGSVARIDAFRTLDESVSSFFSDQRLRQMFNRFATYNGSSPYRAPATLAIIPYVELTMGGWYVRGGMAALAQALGRLATHLGVSIRTGVEVSALLGRDQCSGVRTTEGEEWPADAVICNADAVYAQEVLVPRRRYRSGVPTMLPEPSLSGFVLLLGVRKTFPSLQHHNVFFSSDYRKEFETLLDAGLPAREPTVYLSVSSVTDPSQAPAGSSNLFVLVNAPALGPRFDWKSGAGEYRNHVLATMTRHGIQVAPEEIETERVITPLDFAEKFNAFRGSIYGTSSNGRMAAFLRPPNRSRRMKNLYFAGGSAHPGGGIPLVMLSGRFAADLVAEQFA